MKKCKVAGQKVLHYSVLYRGYFVVNTLRMVLQIFLVFFFSFLNLFLVKLYSKEVVQLSV